MFMNRRGFLWYTTHGKPHKVVTMDHYHRPHDYIMRLKAQMRAPHPEWKDPKGGIGLTRAFVAGTSLHDLYQVKAARLALDRSARRDLKGLAHCLLQDRRQIAQRLQSTLKFSGVKDPEVLIAYELDAGHEAILERLKQASSDQFDSLFVRQQSEAHAGAIQTFLYYDAYGEEPAVKAFAHITLEHLEERLAHVQRLI